MNANVLIHLTLLSAPLSAAERSPADPDTPPSTAAGTDVPSDASSGMSSSPLDASAAPAIVPAKRARPVRGEVFLTVGDGLAWVLEDQPGFLRPHRPGFGLGAAYHLTPQLSLGADLTVPYNSPEVFIPIAAALNVSGYYDLPSSGRTHAVTPFLDLGGSVLLLGPLDDPGALKCVSAGAGVRVALSSALSLRVDTRLMPVLPSLEDIGELGTFGILDAHAGVSYRF